jgi:putative transposase
MLDHMHMCIAIPQNTPWLRRSGFSREECDAIARLSGKDRNFTGEQFWARGYAVSTVGFELEQVRQYIASRRPRMATPEPSEVKK